MSARTGNNVAAGNRGVIRDRLMGRALVIGLTLCLLVSPLLYSGCGEKAGQAYRDPSMTPGEKVSDEQKVTMDDLLFTEFAAQVAMSPDGSKVAWVKKGPTPENELESANLFVSDLQELSTRQMTSYTERAVVEIEWSPDGSSVAYISDAPLPGTQESGAAQVWIAKVDGTEPSPVTTSETGVTGYGWRGPDSIVYIAGEKPADSPPPGDNTVLVSEYAEAPAHLYQVGIEGGEVRKLTDNDDNILAVSVSPDGKHAFMVRTRAKGGMSWSADIPMHYYLLDLETGKQKRVFEEVKHYASMEWSVDSGTFYLVDNHSDEDVIFTYTAIVRTLDLSSGEEGLVDLDWGRGLEEMAPMGPSAPMISPTADGFVATLVDGCNPKVALYTRAGDTWKREMLKGQHQGNIFAIVVSPDGKTVCYDHSSAGEPTQLYVATLKGNDIIEPKRFTTLNPQFEGKSLAKTETITWEGALGDTVEGLLYYPIDYQPGNRYPLMLVIHGGPFECDKDKWPVWAYSWGDPYRILSQKGAFTLSPNYHGSSGYGETSADFGNTMAECRFYSYPLEDIENAIDRLVELEMVDEDRLGTMGWSGGSMLSNALIATDDRFKVASCGAGGAEWISMWGQSAFGDAFAEYYMGDDPIQDPGLYKDPSYEPFYDASKVKTPTIMFQGDQDINVPPPMTWITYRGIQKHGNAPVELFIFPGEPHVLLTLSHKRRKMVEEQKWFDKYFFSSGSPEE